MRRAADLDQSDAVEVAAVGFVEGVTGCGDVTEWSQGCFQGFWLEQLEKRGCHYFHREDDRRSRLEAKETRSLVWGRLGVCCVSST